MTASFDSANLSGHVQHLMTGAATFGSNATAIPAGGRSLTLNGAFFSAAPAIPSRARPGSFAITGTAYKAAGTFAAKKKEIRPPPAPFCCAGIGNRGRNRNKASRHAHIEGIPSEGVVPGGF